MEDKLKSEPDDRILELSTDAPDRLGGETKEQTVVQSERSGGPKTEAGKLVSAQNARKHSFYATKLFRPNEVDTEEHQEFNGMLAALRAEHQPVGVLEEMMIERIATEYIRLGRLLAFEREELYREYAFFNAGVDRVMRYQAAIHRQLGQALTQLERLQRLRLGDAVPAPLSIDLRVTRDLDPETLIPACLTTPAAQCALDSSAVSVDATSAVDDGNPDQENEESADDREAGDEANRGDPESLFCETNSRTSLPVEDSTMTSPSPPPA